MPKSNAREIAEAMQDLAMVTRSSGNYTPLSGPSLTPSTFPRRIGGQSTSSSAISLPVRSRQVIPPQKEKEYDRSRQRSRSPANFTLPIRSREPPPRRESDPMKMKKSSVQTKRCHIIAETQADILPFIAAKSEVEESALSFSNSNIVSETDVLSMRQDFNELSLIGQAQRITSDLIQNSRNSTHLMDDAAISVSRQAAMDLEELDAAYQRLVVYAQENEGVKHEDLLAQLTDIQPRIAGLAVQLWEPVRDENDIKSSRRDQNGGKSGKLNIEESVAPPTSGTVEGSSTPSIGQSDDPLLSKDETESRRFCTHKSCPIKRPHGLGRYLQQGQIPRIWNDYWGYSDPPQSVWQAWVRVEQGTASALDKTQVTAFADCHRWFGLTR